MRFARSLLAAAAVAAACSAGSAYTASNSLPPQIAGYGTVQVIGVNVTSVAYQENTSHTQLLSVVATAEGNVSDGAGYQSLMTAGGTRATCAGTYSDSQTTITCTLPSQTPASAGQDVRLTVAHHG